MQHCPSWLVKADLPQLDTLEHVTVVMYAAADVHC